MEHMTTVCEGSACRFRGLDNAVQYTHSVPEESGPGLLILLLLRSTYSQPLLCCSTASFTRSQSSKWIDLLFSMCNCLHSLCSQGTPALSYYNPCQIASRFIGAQNTGISISVFPLKSPTFFESLLRSERRSRLLVLTVGSGLSRAICDWEALHGYSLGPTVRSVKKGHCGGATSLSFTLGFL